MKILPNSLTKNTEGLQKIPTTIWPVVRDERNGACYFISNHCYHFFLQPPCLACLACLRAMKNSNRFRAFRARVAVPK